MKRTLFLAAVLLMGALSARAQPAQHNEKTVAQLQSEMAAKKLNSVNLTNYYLTRIHTLDQDRSSPVNSVIEVNPDALAMAQNADELRKQGKVLGPLHGIPAIRSCRSLRATCSACRWASASSGRRSASRR